MPEQTITPADVKKLLTEFVSRERQTYVGMRYVPKFADPVAWSADVEYEPLTMVTYNQAIYVSKFYVPIGVQITDTDYWVIWGIQPTDTQVNSAVTDWLDAHPEATTTVQDGAITTAKLADGAVTDAKLVQTGGILESFNEITDGYKLLKFALPSESTIGTYWNTDYVADIPAGTSLKIRYNGDYSGNNFTSLAILGYTSSSDFTTIFTMHYNEPSEIEFVTQEAYQKIGFQLRRSAAENGVSYSLYLLGDYGHALGNSIVTLMDDVAEVMNETSLLASNFDNIFESQVNLFDNATIRNGYNYYGNLRINIAQNDWCSIASPIPIKAGVTYYLKNVRTYFTRIWYANATIVSLSNDDAVRSMSFTAAYDGLIYITFNTASASTKLITTSEALYNSDSTASRYTIDESMVEIDGTQKTYHVKKDGTGDYGSLVECINHINENGIFDATVYLGAGTWDIITELGVGSTYTVDSSHRGLYLQNRTHLVCSSDSVITCNYTGSDTDTITWLSALNAGPYGFTLENATIRSSKCRYSVHDERDTATDQYTNRYINCRMTHDSTSGGYAQCIGGGLGYDGHIIIDGCIFENPHESGTGIVSYHNTWYAGGDGRSTVEVKGSYFKGANTFRCSWFGASTDISTFIVHGNSLGAAIISAPETSDSTIENIELVAWNNEVRS